jgi:hypothetical protein
MRSYIHTYIHTYIHIHIHTSHSYEAMTHGTYLQSKKIYIYIYTHTHTYTYIHTYIHKYTYIYIMMCVCMNILCAFALNTCINSLYIRTHACKNKDMNTVSPAGGYIHTHTHTYIHTYI